MKFWGTQYIKDNKKEKYLISRSESSGDHLPWIQQYLLRKLCFGPRIDNMRWYHGTNLIMALHYKPYVDGDLVFSESLYKELQKKFSQQRCELGRISHKHNQVWQLEVFCNLKKRNLGSIIVKVNMLILC